MPLAVVHVILNPTSGGGRAGRQRDEIDRELQARGVEAAIHVTHSQGHGADLASKLATAGADVIVAAGGDGTVHEVANGILTSGAHTALAVLPIGTGNDFAKVVPGARPLSSAYDVLAAGHVAAFDVGYASWNGGAEYFINGMGSGIDVEVVRQLHSLPHLPGPIKYLMGLLRALRVYQPIALSATTSGERLVRRVMMMAVGNGVCQGGGFYLTPAASPTDGRLELCVIDALPLWKVPIILSRVLRGTHAGHPLVTMRTTEHIRFEANGAAPLYFQLDGELREPPHAQWLDVEIRKALLRVVVAMDTK
jgi:YegS/Rv2252/BmrU family lipid kinase